MSKTNNLGDYLTDIANAIRTKKGTSNKINAQDFSSEIDSIQTGITPSGKIEITDTNEKDVTNYATAQVVDSDLTPDNIKKDINILGVVGTYEGSGGDDTLKALLDYTKSTYYMFYRNTTIIDLTPYISFDATSNVTDMRNMFASCTNLTTVPAFNTSNVTDMRNMFASCTNLKTISLSNTPNVTDMDNMFQNCTALTTVPLFDTSNVTSMAVMFYHCSALTTVPLFDTSKVTYMGSMFEGCTALTSVPLFNTPKVTNMGSMFSGCSNLTTVPAFNTSNVTDMRGMFSGCSNLTTVPAFNTSKVTNMGSMFSGCSNLTTVPAFNTPNVTSMSDMFYNCSNLTTVPAFNVSKVGGTSDMFYNCSNLKELLMYGMKSSFDISASTKFERKDLVTILNNLGTLKYTQVLTMGSTNLAKLTDEDKAIASGKGWTLK